MDIADLLKLAVDSKASDLHLAVGRPPVIRINGELRNTHYDVLRVDDTQDIVSNLLSDRQKRLFEENKELDFALTIAGMGRFRVNIHLQRGSVAAAFRVITDNIRGFEELHLPTRVCERLAASPSGLVLVTGPTGSGKTTTLAAIVDHINRTRECHIITVEDPIEYFHRHKKSLLEQREVHVDTLSFANALKYVLRQDPDVIMVGEMRDLETISSVLTAAETGHLVFSTLHTVDTAQTVDRIIDVFPSHQQSQIRVQLAGVLQGIFCQKLLESAAGGREVAIEVMVATTGIRSLIREGKTHQINTLIEAGGQIGMQTMDRAIADLCRRSRISRETALANAHKPDDLKRHIGG